MLYNYNVDDRVYLLGNKGKHLKYGLVNEANEKAFKVTWEDGSEGTYRHSDGTEYGTSRAEWFKPRVVHLKEGDRESYIDFEEDRKRKEQLTFILQNTIKRLDELRVQLDVDVVAAEIPILQQIIETWEGRRG